MAIQGAINRLIGTAGAAVALGKKLGEEDVKLASPKAPSSEQMKSSSGVDAKMAMKARRIAQQKINAISSNMELSNKAKTRRIGVVMDEYSKTIGGNK